MRLTYQMQDELDSINEQTHDLLKQAFSNPPESFFLVQIVYGEELCANKIKLEILFSETDDKEQSDYSYQFAQAIAIVNYLMRGVSSRWSLLLY